jgi:hypothetical protein
MKDNFEIFCENPDGFKNSTDSYDFYLTPYYFIEQSTCPFEVFIKNDIKTIKYDEYQEIKNKNNLDKNISFIKNPAFTAISISIIIIFILFKLLHL